MRGDTKRPHDRLFRSVFADPHEAATFLRPHLPPALSERFDWSSLALQESKSDHEFSLMSIVPTGRQHDLPHRGG